MPAFQRCETPAMNTTSATQFVTRCFAADETIAILLRGGDPARTVQRIVRVEQATAPAYMRWLAHENASGMNVYAAANPLRCGSRKRTKECIAEIRHLYLDIDVAGDTRLAVLRASDAVPNPTVILSTSPGKYQALWRVEGFDLAQQEGVLKHLANAFGGDPACTDCNRVIRIPGFRNTKYTPSHLVTAEYGSDYASTPSHFCLATVPQDAVLPFRPGAQRLQRKPSTHSEQDWSWVLSELAEGKDAAQLTLSLAERRCDKPNPLYYAQRTVDMASAHLALRAGSSIDDVITSLEDRRRSQLPSVLCPARAREIAQTAARMIARQMPAYPSPKENHNATT